ARLGQPCRVLPYAVCGFPFGAAFRYTDALCLTAAVEAGFQLCRKPSFSDGLFGNPVPSENGNTLKRPIFPENI
ncbi:MAG: hypothetical protein Q4D82_08470, partial [Neisseria sp.]|nr:hypothetical protein [Neisseria sp.]